MKRLIFSALVLSAVTANAQVKDGMVGINTDEPRATLHIEPGVSESKGLIIPRITAAQMKTMTNLAHFGADHHAIITYLKETLPAADRTGKLVDVADPGYYFYNHTAAKWQKFGGGGGEQDLRMIGSNNHLTKDAGIGNNGTSLGTCNANIAIGPNTFSGFANAANVTGHTNIAMGRYIYDNNGGTMSGWANVGVGQELYKMINGGDMQGWRNYAFGDNLFSLQKSNAQFTGNNNLGIGSYLFNLNNGDFSGQYNLGIGNYTIYSKGDFNGNYNMAFGNYTMSTNGDFSGQYNIAIGSYTFRDNSISSGITGNNNIAIGYGAFNGPIGIAGSDNIAIGTNAGYNMAAGNSNIHISTNTGVDTPGVPDNVIVIGSNNFHTGIPDGTIVLGGSSNKVGLGTDTPQAKLDVGGGVRVGDEYGACTYNKAGTIRFDGSNFYGCDGFTWKQLDN